MSIEGLTPEFLAHRTVEFIQLGPSKGVNNFIIHGPRRNVPTNFTTFAALFPQAAAERPLASIFSFGPPHNSEPLYYHKQILKLAVPESIQNLTVRGDAHIQSQLEKRSIRNGWPTIVVGFGSTIETQEEIVALFCVAGMTPSEALSKIQEWARERIATFN